METIRKNSRKRQAILDTLCMSREHPTAEMLYNALKPEYPELSLGTVYRNLSVLTQDGLVADIGSINGQEHYDANLNPHAHFICRNCRRVSDLDIPESFEELCREIDTRYGCAPTGCSLTFTGLCLECREP